MSDTHSPNDDHWRRLAEELGLDVGPAPEQSIHTPPPLPKAADHPVAPPPRREHIEHEAPAPFDHGRHHRPSEAPPDLPDDVLEPTDIEDPPPSRGRRGRSAPVDDLFPAESEAVETDDTEIEDVDAEGSVGEPQPESAEGGIDEQTGKRRRRRRSRRKKKGEPTADVATENGIERPAGEPVAESNDEDDEEEPTAEVVRNWNVPSWDELIGSLHRPER